MEQNANHSRAIAKPPAGIRSSCINEGSMRIRETSTCVNIRRPGEKCRHLGLRLRWPNANDNRRAIVGKSPKNWATGEWTCPSESRFIHTYPWDVEMHYRLTGSQNGTDTISPPDLGLCLPWSSQIFVTRDSDLIQYFNCFASQTLATFKRPTDLGSFLLRMSLSTETLSATALLRSLLAFSSLHRYGLQSQAIELKIAALKALAAASEGVELDTERVIQHVAAGMLLYSFEIHRSSTTSGDWTTYICGVKKVINAVNISQIIYDRGDIECLRDWVCYNDIMTRFTLRHWVRRPEVSSTPPKISYEISYAAPSTEPILGLLSEIYDSLPGDMNSTRIFDDHKEHLKILDWRIRNIAKEDPADEAFVIATSVYLYRLSSAFLEDQAQKKQARIHKGFEVLARLDSCERQFPVFILGCEARTDSQRGGILDLISRTEQKAGSRSFKHVKTILEGIWAQDDLVDRKIDDFGYWNSLSAAMSRCAEPPCFA